MIGSKLLLDVLQNGRPNSGVCLDLAQTPRGVKHYFPAMECHIKSNIQARILDELRPFADEIEAFLRLVAHQLLHHPRR